MNKVKFLTIFITIFAIMASTSKAESLIGGVLRQYKAEEITGIDNWINSKPLKISELKGKVVLIDFWTYSCINCLRTLPYITKWDKAYRDNGLIIIGIHAPEFEFEKNLDNVKKAVEKYGIKYPVATDNSMKTWRNFNNRYWPAHYLIDKKGNIVYTHFGEGHYDVTENNIRYLLGIKEQRVSKEKNTESKSVFRYDQTPETYLGYERAQNFMSSEDTINKIEKYSFPESLSNNSWALSGKWKIEKERIISEEKNAKLRFNFTSKKVFLVMGSGKSKVIKVSLKLNDKELSNSPIIVDKHVLYELVNQEKFGNGLLEITASDASLEAYAFTFGQ